MKFVTGDLWWDRQLCFVRWPSRTRRHTALLSTVGSTATLVATSRLGVGTLLPAAPAPLTLAPGIIPPAGFTAGTAGPASPFRRSLTRAVTSSPVVTASARATRTAARATATATPGPTTAGTPSCRASLAAATAPIAWSARSVLRHEAPLLNDPVAALAANATRATRHCGG